jgi:hypothetical protein
LVCVCIGTELDLLHYCVNMLRNFFKCCRFVKLYIILTGPLGWRMFLGSCVSMYIKGYPYILRNDIWYKRGWADLNSNVNNYTKWFYNFYNFKWYKIQCSWNKKLVHSKTLLQ